MDGDILFCNTIRNQGAEKISMTIFSITAKAAGWKAIISALRNLNEEASFQISNGGLEFHCMDASKISLLTMHWERQNMDELTLDANRTIGFRTDDIDKIFKIFAADDVVTISMIQENLIHIVVKNRSWDVKTVSSEVLDDFKEPQINHTVSISLKPDYLKKIIYDVSVFADTAHFVAGNGMVYLQSKGDGGQSKSLIETDEITISKGANSKYNTTNISQMLFAVGALCDGITVFFSHKKPILLEFEINDIGILRYYLAPLNEDEGMM